METPFVQVDSIFIQMYNQFYEKYHAIFYMLINKENLFNGVQILHKTIYSFVILNTWFLQPIGSLFQIQVILKKNLIVK